MLIFTRDAILMFPYFFNSHKAAGMWDPDVEGSQYKVFTDYALNDPHYEKGGLPDPQRLYNEAYALLVDRQRYALDKLDWPKEEKEAFREYAMRGLSLNAERRYVPFYVAYDHGIRRSVVVLGMDVSERYPDLDWRVAVAYKDRGTYLDEQSLWKDLTSTVAKPFE